MKSVFYADAAPGRAPLRSVKPTVLLAERVWRGRGNECAPPAEAVVKERP